MHKHDFLSLRPFIAEITESLPALSDKTQEWLDIALAESEEKLNKVERIETADSFVEESYAKRHGRYLLTLAAIRAERRQKAMAAHPSSGFLAFEHKEDAQNKEDPTS